MTCSICGRTLDVLGDADSVDCGGDCWGCIREVEAQMGYRAGLTEVEAGHARAELYRYMVLLLAGPAALLWLDETAEQHFHWSHKLHNV